MLKRGLKWEMERVQILSMLIMKLQMQLRWCAMMGRYNAGEKFGKMWFPGEQEKFEHLKNTLLRALTVRYMRQARIEAYLKEKGVDM